MTLPVLKLTVQHALEIPALSYESLAKWHYMRALKDVE
jgi:hypothetical protein